MEKRENMENRDKSVVDNHEERRTADGVDDES